MNNAHTPQSKPNFTFKIPARSARFVSLSLWWMLPNKIIIIKKSTLFRCCSAAETVHFTNMAALSASSRCELFASFCRNGLSDSWLVSCVSLQSRWRLKVIWCRCHLATNQTAANKMYWTVLDGESCCSKNRGWNALYGLQRPQKLCKIRF